MFINVIHLTALTKFFHLEVTVSRACGFSKVWDWKRTGFCRRDSGPMVLHIAYRWILMEPPLIMSVQCRTLTVRCRYPRQRVEAPLFNGNGWANTSLIQSDPLNDGQIYSDALIPSIHVKPPPTIFYNRVHVQGKNSEWSCVNFFLVTTDIILLYLLKQNC